jgi:hypothetical protein
VTVIKKTRLYLETTVFNYYFGENRFGHEETLKLFDAVRDGKFEAYTSIYALYEITNAPHEKQNKMLRLIEDNGIQVLQNNDESDRLADIYIKMVYFRKITV